MGSCWRPFHWKKTDFFLRKPLIPSTSSLKDRISWALFLLYAGVWLVCSYASLTCLGTYICCESVCTMVLSSVLQPKPTTSRIHVLFLSFQRYAVFGVNGLWYRCLTHSSTLHVSYYVHMDKLFVSVLFIIYRVKGSFYGEGWECFQPLIFYYYFKQTFYDIQVSRIQSLWHALQRLWVHQVVIWQATSLWITSSVRKHVCHNSENSILRKRNIF